MTEAEYEFARGWDEALDMVYDVIITMQNSMNFHNPTLDELEARIS